MSLHEDLSDGESEELMFAFEEQDAEALWPRSGGARVFHPIDGRDVERPANPMAAVLERRGKRGRDDGDLEEPEALDADLDEDKPASLRLVSAGLKRSTFRLPMRCTRVVRPVAKRPKTSAYARSATAPACLMGNLSLHRTAELEAKEDVELENEMDNGDAPFRSASIDIPASFHPIQWPGDAVVTRSSGRERSHSCSSSSSSKSWGSGLFCRRSLDVASPLRVHFNDLVLRSSDGSCTGS
ncbi:unnamed protein product [Phytophthora fragariaefolia]|uniref:Unnamed protein product n=1 Tax=Phytophthora fragariaefolia TaxID=1490495 RepID=A0A9W6UEI9_9STRA|nr:unnamed protein product [Phytophthora fragariaefolia]